MQEKSIFGLPSVSSPAFAVLLRGAPSVGCGMRIADSKIQQFKDSRIHRFKDSRIQRIKVDFKIERLILSISHIISEKGLKFWENSYFCTPKITGEMPERSNGAVSKTVVPLRVPRVRIPFSPQPVQDAPRSGAFFITAGAGRARPGLRLL